MATLLENLEDDDDATSSNLRPGRKRKVANEDQHEDLAEVPQHLPDNPMAPPASKRRNKGDGMLPLQMLPPMALQPPMPVQVRRPGPTPAYSVPAQALSNHSTVQVSSQFCTPADSLVSSSQSHLPAGSVVSAPALTPFEQAPTPVLVGPSDFTQTFTYASGSHSAASSRIHPPAGLEVSVLRPTASSQSARRNDQEIRQSPYQPATNSGLFFGSPDFPRTELDPELDPDLAPSFPVQKSS